MKAKTVGKTLRDLDAEALVDTLAYTLLKGLGNTTADTLTCLEAEAQVKTEGNTVSEVED